MQTHFCFAVATLVALLFAGASSASAQVKVPDDVELIREVEFGKGGERAMTLHIVRPKTPTKGLMPAVIWIHGGGWEAFSKDGGIGKLVPLAQRGYFGVTIDYRFSQEAIFPAQIEDCKCAVRFLRAKAAEYKIDPERIGAWGYSSGGHLAALLGTSGGVTKLEGNGGWPEHSSRVQAVCEYAGPSDFVSWGDAAPKQVPKLLGGKASEVKERAADASPITFIGKDMPPFFIVHGEKDELVPVSQSEMFYTALKKARADVSIHIIPGGSHNISNADIDQMAVEFFEKKLKGSGVKKKARK